MQVQNMRDERQVGKLNLVLFADSRNVTNDTELNERKLGFEQDDYKSLIVVINCLQQGTVETRNTFFLFLNLIAEV